MVPLAASGCGFGCTYCYVPDRLRTAEPLPRAELLRDLQSLTSDSRFGPETVISLGCDSEPVLESTLPNLLFVLDYFTKYGNPIQIAMKSEVPRAVTERLEDPAFRFPPVLFTSMTSLSKWRQLEPGAPPVSERMRNLGVERRRWKSCVLIKPVMAQTLKEAGTIKEFLLGSGADAVVAGVKYRPNQPDVTFGSSEHALADGWWSEPSSRDHQEFVSDLAKALSIPVFMSSLCASAYFGVAPLALEVARDPRGLCVGCGVCADVTATANGFAPVQVRSHRPVGVNGAAVSF